MESGGRAAGRIAARRGHRAPVVPAFVEGANGALFQLPGCVHPRLADGAAWARAAEQTRPARRGPRRNAGRAREARSRSPRRANRRIIFAGGLTCSARRERFKPRTSRSAAARTRGGALQPIATASPAAVLAAEIAGLPTDALLNRSGDLEVYITGAADIPNVLPRDRAAA